MILIIKEYQTVAIVKLMEIAADYLDIVTLVHLDII